MEEYRELCEELSGIYKKYEGILSMTNPIYKFIDKLMECIRLDRGISEEEEDSI